MRIEEAIQLQAGGPGSGRHPEAGKFVKQSSRYGIVHYKTPKGTTLRVETTKAREQPSGKYKSIYEGKIGKDSMTHIRSGDSTEMDKVLKDRYKIIDQDDKSNKGVAQPKISRRSSEQKRRDNFVLYD